MSLFFTWAWCFQGSVKVLTVCTTFSCELQTVFLFPAGSWKAQGLILFIDSEHKAGVRAQRLFYSCICACVYFLCLWTNAFLDLCCLWIHQVGLNNLKIPSCNFSDQHCGYDLTFAKGLQCLFGEYLLFWCRSAFLNQKCYGIHVVHQHLLLLCFFFVEFFCMFMNSLCWLWPLTTSRQL